MILILVCLSTQTSLKKNPKISDNKNALTQLKRDIQNQYEEKLSIVKENLDQKHKDADDNANYQGPIKKCSDLRNKLQQIYDDFMKNKDHSFNYVSLFKKFNQEKIEKIKNKLSEKWNELHACLKGIACSIEKKKKN